MNGKAAKRIRYAIRCMYGAGTQHLTKKAAAKAVETYKRLKAEYKALPYHRRDVHQESHSFVLQVKHGNATRRYPA